MVSVLHISDLHRDTGSALTTGSLLESLRLDRDRYVNDGFQKPDLAIVSGDVVCGVASNDADSDRALKAQYDEAEDFLIKLCDLFFGGDRERVIIAPGNHDVSHPHVLRSMTAEKLPSDAGKRAILAKQLAVEGTQYRWVWSDFALWRISNPECYKQRMEPFATFYKAFYRGKREYSLATEEQYAIHDFRELGVVVATLSSCCDNDLFNRSGRIHPDCIAGATREVAVQVRNGRIPIAVWHHNLAGGPKDSDYIDGEFLQSLMDGGFVIGLHGHQHRPQFLQRRFTADGKRQLAAISAGTLCGGPDSLPVGKKRAYNLVRIDIEARKCAVHVREMKNDAFSMPVWGEAYVPEFSGSSMEFTLDMQLLAVLGDSAASEASNQDVLGDSAASEASNLLGQQRERTAFEVAQKHPENEWARRVAVEALLRLDDWAEIRRFCATPQSSTELISLIEALYQLGDKVALREFIESEPVARNSDNAVQQSVAAARARLGERR
ncbi:MAG: metallophosphoesterase [Sterolibacterium sp.]